MDMPLMRDAHHRSVPAWLQEALSKVNISQLTYDAVTPDDHVIGEVGDIALRAIALMYFLEREIEEDRRSYRASNDRVILGKLYQRRVTYFIVAGICYKNLLVDLQDWDGMSIISLRTSGDTFVAVTTDEIEHVAQHKHLPGAHFDANELDTIGLYFCLDVVPER